MVLLLNILLAALLLSFPRGVDSSACSSQCNALNEAIGGCPDGNDTCVCTQQFDASLVTCVNCLVKSVGLDSSAIGSLQENLNTYNQRCSSGKRPVPQYQIGQPNPTQSGSSPSSSMHDGSGSHASHAGSIGTSLVLILSSLF